MIMTALNGPPAGLGLMATWEQWANPISVWFSTLPLKNARRIFAQRVRSPFENTAYMRGVFELGWMLVYFTFMAGNTLDRKGLHEQQKECLDSYLSHPELPLLLLIKEVYRYMRLSNWGDRLKDASPYFDDFLEHTIDLWATSHVFKVGYRLRLEVSSSNFPRNDRNADTGHDSGGHGELRVVQQTIFTNTAIGHI